jgi:transposase-like protein
MKRRRWDSKTKTKIVLEGLSGRPVSEICNDYGIHQNQYYTWREIRYQTLLDYWCAVHAIYYNT